MYTIIGNNGIIIHDKTIADSGYRIRFGSLSLSYNRAGILYFTIPATNEAYLQNALVPLFGRVTVYKDNKFVWHGRVMELKMNNGEVQVTCEGIFNVLNDSIILDKEMPKPGVSAEEAIRKIVDIHNSRVEPGKWINIKCKGMGLVNTPKIDYPGPYECGNALLKLFASIARFYVDENRTLTVVNQMLEDYVINQTLTSDSNMLDFRAMTDATSVFTVVYPIGKNGLTLPEGFVYHDANFFLFGRITKVLRFDDASTCAELRKEAMNALNDVSESVWLEARADDLADIDDSFTDHIGVGNFVRVISPKHGVDKDLMCHKIVIDLLDKEKSIYYLGSIPPSITGSHAETFRTSRSKKQFVLFNRKVVPIKKIHN